MARVVVAGSLRIATALLLMAAGCSLDTHPLRSRTDNQYRNDASAGPVDARVSDLESDASTTGDASADACDDDADCRGPECEPGRAQCQGESALRACDDSGRWSAAISCRTVCRDDRCYECLPGAAECSGAQSRLCSADGRWNEIACANGCANGHCNGCRPGALRCTDNSAQVCAADGTWGRDRGCAENGCAGERCAACRKGAVECDGPGRRVCGDDGQWGATQTCPAGCTSGECETPCMPGAARCIASGAQTCGVDQRWTVPKPCAMGCNGISCAQCQEGAIECLTATTLRICRENAWGQIQSCRPNAKCDSTPDNGNLCPCDRGYRDPHPNPGLCESNGDDDR